jgi:hypothetical protein
LGYFDNASKRGFDPDRSSRIAELKAQRKSLDDRTAQEDSLK